MSRIGHSSKERNKTMADKKLIDELLEKNKAKPLVKKYLTRELILPACPTCGEVVFSTVHGSYCEWCGQRLMKDVWER